MLAATEPVRFDRLAEEVGALLERKPNWARTFRSEGGAARLAGAALEVLVGHGLVRGAQEGGAAVCRPLPAAHRYQVDDSVFEEGT